MADVVLLYGPGQTYTTEEAVWAAIPDNVIASGNRYIIRSTGEVVRANKWKPSGKICDATHNIIFEANPGVGWKNGDIPARYQSTNAAIKITGAYIDGIEIDQDYMVFRNMQVFMSGGGNSGTGISATANAPNAVVEDILVRMAQSGNYVFGANQSYGKWQRILVILTGANSHGVIAAGTTTININKVTVVRVGQPVGGGYGIYTLSANTSVLKVQNCVAMGMTGFADVPTNLNVASSNNASDGVVGRGTNNKDNLVITDTFRDTTLASADWRLKPTSVLLTAGTDGGEIGAIYTPPPPASALVLSGASNVTIGFPANLSLTTDMALTDGQSYDWVIDDSDQFGGVFNPSSGTLTTQNRSQAIVYTPSETVGDRVITASSVGNLLTPATKPFTATAPAPATTLVLNVADTGVVGVAIPVEVSTDKPLRNAETETVELSSANGIFNPTTLTLNPGNQTGISMFTPSSAGMRIIFANAVGNPALASASDVVTVTLPPPVMVAGQNNYEIGPGHQFATWAAFRGFINTKNLVTLQAKVRAVYFGPGEEIIGDLLPVDANATYDITIITDLASSYIGAATANKFQYPNAGVELTFKSVVNVIRGTRFIGFRYNFQGAGVLNFGTNYGGATNSYLSGVVKTDSTTVASCITSGSYAHSLNVDAAVFIRTAGTGRMLGLGDGRGYVNGVTFVCTGTGTVNGMSYGQYGGTGASLIQNNAFIACGDEPIKFIGTDATNPENYKNNYTDTAMNPAKLEMIKGMTAIVGSPFVIDVNSDLRPILNGPLYHKGNTLVMSKNDTFGQNRGKTADAGAYQLEPASTLPVLDIISVIVNGQNVTINVATDNNPSRVMCSVSPQAGIVPNSAEMVGPVDMELGVGTAIKQLEVQPGYYSVAVSGSNDGGSTVATGSFNFKINGITGNPEALEVPVVPGGEVPVVSTVTSVTITPATAIGSVKLNATVNGINPSQAVIWSKVGGGTLDTTGDFVEPAKTNVPQVITAKATSVQDPTKFATAVITIPAAVVVVDPPVDTTPTITGFTVTPANAVVDGSLDFNVVVNGLNNPAQTVSFATDLGTVDANGFVVATKTNQVQIGHLTITSTVDPTKSTTVTFTVPAQVVVVDPPPVIGGVQMTPVRFHFMALTSLPMIGATVDIYLPKPIINQQARGIALPGKISTVVGEDGFVMVDLMPADRIYTVAVYDPVTDTGASYKFLVPSVTAPAIVDFQDIIVTQDMLDTEYDTATLTLILNAKVAALAAAAQAQALLDSLKGPEGAKQVGFKTESVFTALENVGTDSSGGGGSTVPATIRPEALLTPDVNGVITPDGSISNHFRFVMTKDIKLGNPINYTGPANIRLTGYQDVVGGHKMSFGLDYLMPAAQIYVPPQGGNAAFTIELNSTVNPKTDLTNWIMFAFPDKSVSTGYGLIAELVQIGNQKYYSLGAAFPVLGNGQTAIILRNGLSNEATGTKIGVAGETYKIFGAPVPSNGADQRPILRLLTVDFGEGPPRGANRPAFGKSLLNFETAGTSIVRDIRITGARNDGSNAAGFHANNLAANLILQNVEITDCNNGVMSGNQGMTGVIELYDVLIDKCGIGGPTADMSHGGTTVGFTHGTYFGHNDSTVIMKRVSITNAIEGNNLKSRTGTLIMDQVLCQDSANGRELEFPNGGVLHVTNCILSRRFGNGGGNNLNIIGNNAALDGQEGIDTSRPREYIFRNVRFEHLIAVAGRDPHFIASLDPTVPMRFIDCEFIGDQAKANQTTTAENLYAGCVTVNGIRYRPGAEPIFEYTGGPLGPVLPVGYFPIPMTPIEG